MTTRSEGVAVMKASVRRKDSAFKHTVQVRDHQLTVDEPLESGGDDAGPDPQELLAVSLASCTAITMEMYAARKGWDIGNVEVDVQYTPAERGCPTKFDIVLRLPDDLPPEQVERLQVIAAKCPVHRTLDGEVMFQERVERTRSSRLRVTLRGRVGLAGVLLDTSSLSEPQADEQVAAAVLVPLYVTRDGELRVVLTRRRADLRRHAGEISFPGGRRDPEDATLIDTALREAEEEIGLARAEVTIVGALERTSTFVTNYVIHPFVGLLDGERAWRVSEVEVDAVLEPSLNVVRAGRARTRMERRGIAFETDAYVFDDHLIWGATARILEDLLERIEPLLDRRANA